MFAGYYSEHNNFYYYLHSIGIENWDTEELSILPRWQTYYMADLELKPRNLRSKTMNLILASTLFSFDYIISSLPFRWKLFISTFFYLHNPPSCDACVKFRCTEINLTLLSVQGQKTKLKLWFEPFSLSARLEAYELCHSTVKGKGFQKINYITN